MADCDAGRDLLRASLVGKAVVLVAPTIVYETLQIRDETSLLRNMALITMPNWRRLMPDAYAECLEILGEVLRLRPGWIPSPPVADSAKAVRHDWVRKKGGFWWRAETDPVLLARELGIFDGPQSNITALTRGESHDRRKQGAELREAAQWKLDQILVSPEGPLPGWQGHPVAAWRMAALTTVSAGLRMKGHPYVDWLQSRVDLNQAVLANPSWVSFWLHDVSENAMPRIWLRWSFEWMQQFQKVTPGSPADVSVATYLPECDFFISNDHAIVRNAIAASKYSPCAIGTAKWLPAGREGVDALLDLIRTRTDQGAASLGPSPCD